MAGETSEFLVLSRGQWDPSLSRERIQQAIDDFYVWHDRLVAEKKMRPGTRLGAEGKTVLKGGLVTDGPFGETKELIGGYWFIDAPSLEEAARIASENPCLECGLFFEIRPTERIKASAFAVTTETPAELRR
jgi:hypothetical protein